MSKPAKLITAITLTILGVALLAPMQPTFAADDNIFNNDHVDNRIKAASGCPNAGTADELPHVVTNIINGIILVAGFIAVVFIVVGGIQYMTSVGDSAKTKKAKDTLLYSCIGLIICALAFAIVNFVILSIIA